MHFYAFECAFLISLARYWHVHDANYFLPTFSATSAQGLLFGPILDWCWTDVEACIFFAWIFEKKIQAIEKKIQVVKRWTKKNRLAG